ncbi:Thioredoxin reductase [Caenispirillum salinarum AK4]|uniref:Ferredoxin--NADP reductase n=2 Tax=Caenispirillum TaxID=414051 RepID=K9HPK3_9PROT|nr:Thioredoxin reductase [Caenispirillum salinarum AK4]
MQRPILRRRGLIFRPAAAIVGRDRIPYRIASGIPLMQTTFETDAIVIGAGPVGLFTVFQCGMVRIGCHVVDVLDEIGGQCTALYPEKPIYDVPGFPRVDAGKLIELLHEQAEPFKPVFHLGQQVVGLERLEAEGKWRATTSKGTVIDAPVVIIAAGVGAFGPNRPPMEGLEQYEGTSVFYMVGRRESFRDRHIVIAGGGDSAVDWAISLSEVAASVKVVHRRAKFRCAPDSFDKLKALDGAGEVELVTPYQLDRLEGDGTTLSAVIVRDLDGNERRLEADTLLPFFGLSTNLGPIAEWGLEMGAKNTIAIDQTTSETNQKGIFAVGDIASYPHKLKLILTGFAEAAQAAHAAFGYVHPGEALHFEHSTTTGVPAGE